ncbi:DUF3089 domain-containing protein [Solidesulfovibrio fructosivorans]|uniref:DUF3089 domain-containing protein n=1 Tax=Solidesulfovibrio fructosivorans TaxID=878 RepID=UPI001F1E4A84|nr:DUF3089 domain-containing protein [Solidesulfovibrio fructosivorans]
MLRLGCRFGGMVLLAVLLLCGKAFCDSAQQHGEVDYGKKKNWSMLPEKTAHAVDVFFVHPTTYGPPANGNTPPPWTTRRSTPKRTRIPSAG